VARRAGAAAYLLEDAESLDPAWLVGATTVGVTAGASAPPHLVDEVVDVVRGLGRTRLREHRAVDEQMSFALPKEVS
jgi:4-hydroxy-3-methylbut-2-enyl diphosphate reductase